MKKTLDEKLARIHADPHGARDFILADAKDADMAFGISAPGKSPETHVSEARAKTLAEYRDQIRQVIDHGLVDIVLMSGHTSAHLTIQERLFDNSKITPAARANDATEVFAVRGGYYGTVPSRPFRSATLDHLQCGHVDCSPEERTLGANLGLYSVTFNNRLEDDMRTLNAYHAFLQEAERVGFRHFLEVFDPNNSQGLDPDKMPAFVNDHVARSLAGVAPAGRPVFLKMVYHGPKAMEELVTYDPHLVVGILGGSSGTTYDAFKLLSEAKKYGARAALFGRKINNSECQLAFINFLRLIADGEITAEEATPAYHAVLDKLGIRPWRTLEEDMQLTNQVMSYASNSVSVPAGVPTSGTDKTQDMSQAEKFRYHQQDVAEVPPTKQPSAAKEKDCGCGCGGSNPKACPTKPPAANGWPLLENGEPDFATMTQRQKLDWNQQQRDQLYGTFH